jgi:hypothetical protein
MAGFNEILVGRYNRFFQKLMSMKGAATVSELASEVVPSLPLFSGVENRYLEQWDRFGIGGGSPGVAAQFAEWRFNNPVGSNVIAVIEKLTMSGSASGVYEVQYGQGQPNLATVIVNGGRGLDGRARLNGTLSVSFGSTAGGSQIGTTIGEVNMLLSTFWEVIQTDNQEIVLGPGDSLQLQEQVANNGLTMTCIWRERLLEESERK